MLTDESLSCPDCNETYLHHGTVQVYTRANEDGPGRRVVVSSKSGLPEEVVSITEGFAGRRDDVRIGFEGEHCKKTRWLYAIQHKGQTIWPPVRSQHRSF